MILLTIVIFIAILGLLVFVHELGHFIMAKRAGMRVDEFGFGFPPRIFGIKRGETLYSVNLIPLGGFVKILGEDGSETADERSFSNKSGWQRFAVLIAGVTMNVILAWVLLSIGLMIGIPTLLSEGEALPKSAHLKDQAVGILQIQEHTPAAEAGLKAGDLILKVNDQPVSTIEQARDLTAQNLGKENIYQIKRGQDVFDKKITPREKPPAGEGPLGVALGSVGLISYPWYMAIYQGLLGTINLLVGTLVAFWGLFVQLFHGESVSGSLSGPVGIAVLTRDVTRLGFAYLIQFTAVLSVNLAIINAIPFPALDGGRILFLIVEKIRRRKLPIQAEQIANTVGFLLLLLLMVAVTVHDFGKFDIIQKIRNLV